MAKKKVIKVVRPVRTVGGRPVKGVIPPQLRAFLFKKKGTRK